MWTSGTATDHDDLLTQIVNFVTDSYEMGIDDVWELETDRASTAYTGEREVWLKGPGVSGVPVYVGITTRTDTGEDYFNFETRIASNFVESSSFVDQLSISPTTGVLLRNATIPYWVVANRRNIRLVARVGTVYQTAYWGFSLPYAQPSQWPDAYVNAGMWTDGGTRFSSESDSHNFMADPYHTAASGWSGSIYLKTFANGWQGFNHRDTSSNNRVWPRVTYWNSTTNMTDILRFDQERVLFPLIMWRTDNDNPLVYGELEGVYWLSGQGLASEDELTINGDTYLAVQNAFRTGVSDFIAVKLED